VRRHYLRGKTQSRRSPVVDRRAESCGKGAQPLNLTASGVLRWKLEKTERSCCWHTGQVGFALNVIQQTVGDVRLNGEGKDEQHTYPSRLGNVTEGFGGKKRNRSGLIVTAGDVSHRAKAAAWRSRKPRKGHKKAETRNCRQRGTTRRRTIDIAQS